MSFISRQSTKQEGRSGKKAPAWEDLLLFVSTDCVRYQQQKQHSYVVGGNVRLFISAVVSDTFNGYENVIN